MDFTDPTRRPKAFVLDGETFTAPAKLSAKTLRKIAALRGDFGSLRAEDDIDKIFDVVSRVYALFLPGDDGRRFLARLNADAEEDPDVVPIDLMAEAVPILYWLLEQYGLRPTKPSPASPAGLTDDPMATLNDGTSSTDGASPSESTI